MKFRLIKSPNPRIHKLWFLTIVLLVVINQSCVVNKKYQYLQKDDVNIKSEELLMDSVIRVYSLDNFEYRLQPEDIVSVQFYSLTPQELNFFNLKQAQTITGGGNAYGNAGNALVNGYLIDESGNIRFPVVGDVKIEGMTVFEAQNEIQRVAEQFLEDPIVELRLLNFRFTLLGEVRREGVYNSVNQRIHILEAIGLSGGFTDLADKSGIKIIRQNGRTAEVYYLNLLDESTIESDHYYVNQQDVIVVPPLKQRPYQVYFGKNLALVISSVSLLILVLNLIK